MGSRSDFPSKLASLPCHLPSYGGMLSSSQPYQSEEGQDMNQAQDCRIGERNPIKQGLFQATQSLGAPSGTSEISGPQSLFPPLWGSGPCATEGLQLCDLQTGGTRQS